MNFNEELKAMVMSIEGAKAAILMGFDGIPVAEAKVDAGNMAIQDIAVEYSQLLSDALKIVRGNDLGQMSEMVVGTDRYRIIFQVVGAQFFLGLFVSHDSILGKGRYALRRAAPRFEESL